MLANRMKAPAQNGGLKCGAASQKAVRKRVPRRAALCCAAPHRTAPHRTALH